MPFRSNITGLQVLWILPEGEELEFVTLDPPTPDSSNWAIGKWGHSNHYYHYPVTIVRENLTVTVSDYRRPPEWTDPQWTYHKGTLTIQLNEDEKPEVVRWRLEGKKQIVDLRRGIDWNFFSSPHQIQTRGQITTKRYLRPEQQLMREILLAEVGRCVVSGCTIEACLEAAHILPVKNGGIEAKENMILMRADIHRLYDAGLLAIDMDGSYWATLGVSEYVRRIIFEANQIREGYIWTPHQRWIEARLIIQPLNQNHDYCEFLVSVCRYGFMIITVKVPDYCGGEAYLEFNKIAIRNIGIAPDDFEFSG